jgi:hypothetical protein
MIINNCHTITTTLLIKHGYLKQGIEKHGTIKWSVNGKDTISISIESHTINSPYILLKYKYGEEFIKYKIRIEYVSSNLGVGEVVYLICPHTNKRCRKLYRNGKYFLHRESFITPLYQSQLEAKYLRDIVPYNKYEKVLQELRKPYFKRWYKGKPTKRYLRINNLINLLTAKYNLCH